MARILFYSPFNQRSRDTESLMIAFVNQGHQVFSLSQQEGKEIHEFLKGHGVETRSYVVQGERSGKRYYLKHILFFIRYCNNNKIDVVYSHLEPANFVASIGQYFIKATTFLCRHHIDEGKLYNFDGDLYYKLTYRLAKSVIVVSDHAKRYMVDHERIPAKKILHINLGYNFDLYPRPNFETVKRIRSAAKVLLVSACRMTQYKRPNLVVEVLNRVVDMGIDARLIMLGKGEMEKDIVNLIASFGLTGRVVMAGYVGNIMDYLAAADFLLHPSVLESSCVIVKEAGLAHTPVIVCKGVGDFDEFLVNEQNAFLVNRENFVEDSSQIIRKYAADEKSRQAIGAKLEHSVREHFSIERVLPKYDQLNLPA